MKKMTIASSLILATIAVGTLPVQAEEVANRDTDAIVKFKAPDEKDPNSKNPVVDPEDKDGKDPVTPIDPVNPDKPVDEGSTGPLTLDYASSLNFGENIISTKDEIYFASAQVLKDKNNVEKTGPLFAQITDNRGTLEGWILSAKQNSAFTSATKGQTLEGTEIVFQNASAVTAGQSAAPTSLASVTFGTVGESHNVMVAATDQGAGKWSYLYGNASSIAEVDGRQVMKDVQLKVPGKSVKLNDAYKTTITWTLANTPV
ncbi:MULTISPECIES: WxL domain-containing protein ElrD [Enterococcus]|uniref:WxL domain-containing protein ElrD n=1 Tax=Enterococcus TaxID=1350 RepID=UPI000F80C1FA|nr:MULTISPECIES: WxL domain-containing protein ElrD [Enterococcus]EGO6568387.1 WxL domain-containing protein [Enterococcus faecalis]EGO6688123.1 WxL domain-containing protein [Enterococcus faecalis]EGO7755876.1 WxL domain-containing protein [Enterococcus faecalis]EGO7933921.1 WxL domain-containing protein [Enterococcus faecalis]EGO8279454.1 WxL domain-containing protein [Enterococcus faecalis]